MRSAVSAAATAAVLFLGSFPAAAQLQAPQVQCAERDNIVSDLEGQFAERQKAIGLTAEGRLIEIFAAEDGTWTMLLTTADSVSCIVSHGVNWYGGSKEERAGTASSVTAPDTDLTTRRDAGMTLRK